jgi:beta-lactam-binding protein with PASTA domain
MANYFEITPPEGLSVVKLDSSGRGKVQYTVKNVSPIKRDARALVVSMPSAPGAVEKGWVKVEPPTDKPIESGKSENYVVTIAVPPKSPPGSYSFRLETVLVSKTDEGDQSQPLTFNVAAAPPPPPFKWWIPVVAVIALIIIGVVVWLLLPKGVAVPDLKGQTPADAKQTLTAAGFVLDPEFDPNNDLVESSPDLAGKIAAQSPDAGAKAKKGSTVKVQIGSVSVTVPNVQGQPLEDASKALTQAGLLVGTVKTLHTTDAAGGTVLSQSRPPGDKVKSNSAIDLTVVQQVVPVPTVANLSTGQAALALQQSKLVLKGFQGNQMNANVVGANPAEGTLVDVGTQVTLIVPTAGPPCAPNCFVPIWQYQTLQQGKNGQFRAQHW